MLRMQTHVPSFTFYESAPVKTGFADHSSLNRLLYFFTLLSLLTLTSACSPIDSLRPFDQTEAAKVLQSNYISRPAKYQISLFLPEKNGWQKINLSLSKLGTPIMLIPKNETSYNWTQSLRTKISGYRNQPDLTLDKFIKQQIDEVNEQC